MLKSFARRWTRTLTGFAGLGGIRWMSRVMRSRSHHLEDLAPHDIADDATRYLPTGPGGHPTAYCDLGVGEHALVFLHGFGGRLQTWAAVQSALATEYRTVAIDLWGFGASGRPPAMKPRDWVAQVFGVMDALGIASATFIGHSLGGRVSLMCAAAHPKRVRGLVLCDCDWGQAMHGYLLAWGLSHTPVLPSMLRRLRGNPAHLRDLMGMVYGKDFAITDDFIDLYQQPLRVRGTARTLQGIGRAHPTRDILGLTRKVRCPALLLWGEHDPVVPVEWGHMLERKLRDARLVVLPARGHFPQDEDPEAVTAEIRRFLTEQAHMSPLAA